jgi:hypothetical protein
MVEENHMKLRQVYEQSYWSSVWLSKPLIGGLKTEFPHHNDFVHPTCSKEEKKTSIPARIYAEYSRQLVEPAPYVVTAFWRRLVSDESSLSQLSGVSCHTTRKSDLRYFWSSVLRPDGMFSIASIAVDMVDLSDQSCFKTLTSCTTHSKVPRKRDPDHLCCMQPHHARTNL